MLQGEKEERNMCCKVNSSREMCVIKWTDRPKYIFLNKQIGRKYVIALNVSRNVWYRENIMNQNYVRNCGCRTKY